MKGIRGRFKGEKSEATVAKMSPADQEKYYAYVELVKLAIQNNSTFPEPPVYESLVVEEKPKTGKRGRPRQTVEGQEQIEIVPETKEALVKILIEKQTAYQNEHILHGDSANGTPGGENWYDPSGAKFDSGETVIHHVSREGFCIIETNELYWINQIKDMIERTPDKVIVLPNYSNEDMIRVKVPYSAMKKCKPSARVISDETREHMRELGRLMQEKRREIERQNKNEKKEDALEENTIEEIEETREEDVVVEVVKKPTQKGIPSENVVDTDYKDVEETEEDRINEESDEDFEGIPMRVITEADLEADRKFNGEGT